ncbi:hypothetical protein [Rhodoferax sp.]|uniref:hypothetical protein n=1 Tax=Rhodoferax sp. TaxID=50421 RepID=UPI00276F46DD|nr:hypothetical protein [Rhodoferax sp.]
MREVLNSDECGELASLWRRRQHLSEQEVGRIYWVVEKTLRGYSPPEVQALGEGHEELIAQFIFSKILRLDCVDPAPEVTDVAPDDGHSAPSSSFALCAYFRRYLIDCMRASSFRRRVALEEQALENQAEECLPNCENLEACLAEHGLSWVKVSAAARSFIAALPNAERILLCESFGRDAAGGLSGVASRHAIASYHYRAGRLGLVHKRQGLPGDFAKTLIGTWVQQELGVPIAPDNMAVILAVFKILGVEASYA